MKPEERNQLIDELLDGVIAESDFVRLEAEMHVNSEAREAYYERLELSTLLAIDAEESGDDLKKDKIVEFPVSPLAGWWAAAAAVAIGALVGMIGWVSAPGSNEVADRSESVAHGFAVVGEIGDAVWADGHTLRRGDLVPQGRLKLASGTVQLDLFSGVTLLIEGEAEFEVLSAMEMAMQLGKLQARVPEPAQGFRIHTAGGEVVDLGTEFAIDVTPEHADIAVLDGEVEWYSPTEPMEKVVGGESIRHTIGGDSARMNFDATAMATVGDRLQELSTQRLSKEERWLAHREELASDPRLLAYYPMTQPGHWERTLQDASPMGRDGAIVAAQRAPSRWGGDLNALDFGSTGSRVRVNIPGDHTSITFYCWVQINSLDRWYNSLFLTDGHDLHDPHWQIMDDGRLFFSVRAVNEKGKTDKHIAYSPVIWTPKQAGQWMQLAAVYDTESWTITHYVNGERVSVDEIEERLRSPIVHIGSASIGNWSNPLRDEPEFAVRNLNGSIDEFAVFSAALTPAEIQNLYEIGKP
ncbi:MAG: LamG-like jellyroll fold domain-containing protein [Verrucomicrobiota bacterium]